MSEIGECVESVNATGYRAQLYLIESGLHGELIATYADLRRFVDIYVDVLRMDGQCRSRRRQTQISAATGVHAHVTRYHLLQLPLLTASSNTPEGGRHYKRKGAVESRTDKQIDRF